MDNQEQNDPVWDLLKHASTTRPGPMFSRNVMREIRLSEGKQGGFASLLGGVLRSHPLLGGLVAAVLAVACLVLFRSGDTPGTVGEPVVYEETNTFDPAAEFEQMEYLGQLMAVADPGDLSDDVLADLFY